MRRLALLLVVLLAACDFTSVVAIPASQWQPNSAGQREKARVFEQVSRTIGAAAEQECRRRSQSANCDFVFLVDLSSKAPANAFQTLDKDGKPLIIFTQQMIGSTQNADEMAFVMGHEAAHHILGHIARQAENAKESARIFGELARKQGEDDAGIERAQALGAEVGAQNYTREFELEADRLGTKITHAAGYDPLVGMVFFQRIPDPGDRFLATHPPNAKRVEVVLQTARQLGLR
ncbi:peptidase M48 [Ruegeria sp. ANG-R]|uniref:M48 family metallopeptidase n=1 Tax=Ruegeria sp. ANG-R TaxID=1577903 RepID=UPI00057CE585|nr:M48 family metallopeptidase [Ruegeria sp. ANG-R]KIC41540.1 peptidase M48 [Ruegeria sp. ANG-R]